MSNVSLTIFAFIFSCQVFWVSKEAVASKPPPAVVTQQVKVENSAQLTTVKTTYGYWEPKDLVLAAGVAVTLLLGIWNVFANSRSGQRTIFVNTVTSQRIKWIEQLRQDISAFSGLVYHWAITDLPDPKEEQQIIKEIDRLKHVIRLRLNPVGTYDKTIEYILLEIPRHTSNQAKIEELLEQLTITAQALLKEEWEKVKSESKKGPLSDRA